ncbi:LacI family DNA-binding transcriptional regulator [Actinomyces ruminis]|uniref:LacI family DNA-binding transcriptional regulator n=1 Tax=Actinomyces ruminis TaxID=1937003 RepID=UPI001C557CBF|nr:LacI family DNA-binding transcriptional regulator [Actinomyces ruminis]
MTLDDVAAAAGVSKSAASKALNNRADVSAATRERVLAASEDLATCARRRRRPAPTRR